MVKLSICVFPYELDKGDQDLDLQTLQELIAMGDMYNVELLKEAAFKIMEKFYSLENIIEILEFKKKYQNKNLEDSLKYIVANVNYSQLQSWGLLKKHPEIALLYLDLMEKSTNNVGLGRGRGRGIPRGRGNGCLYSWEDDQMKQYGQSYSSHFPFGRK